MTETEFSPEALHRLLVTLAESEDELLENMRVHFELIREGYRPPGLHEALLNGCNLSAAIRRLQISRHESNAVWTNLRRAYARLQTPFSSGE